MGSMFTKQRTKDEALRRDFGIGKLLKSETKQARKTIKILLLGAR
jgi:hypothetical protein